MSISNVTVAPPGQDQYTSQLNELGLNPLAQTTPTVAQEVKSQATQITPQAAPIINDSSRGEKPGSVGSTAPSIGGHYDGQGVSSAASRSDANNHGYFNKPTGLGLAGALPGPLGLAGKAINAGINVNNKAAVDSARNRLGMDPNKGPLSTLKGLARDNQGYVGDVDIQGNKFSVGLEATDKWGRTTLTPDEAAKRGLVTNVNDPEFGKMKVSELSEEDTKARQESFQKENDTGMFSSVGSFLSGIFGTKEKTSTSASLGKNSFPSAPKSQASGFGSGSDGWNGGSSHGGFKSEAGESRAKGMSPGAAGAIGAGGSKGPKGAY